MLWQCGVCVSCRNGRVYQLYMCCRNGRVHVCHENWEYVLQKCGVGVVEIRDMNQLREWGVYTCYRNGGILYCRNGVCV